ncbi:hypothetical protein PoB_003485700 [Plakobranchus ocellatus]|uniref:Uncharacterized protein n=1 Tax=Plakobranchus ocellatus TaxID=259542 RepID=A0AAV4AN48_9GAST|nr:hypothetical protein PoB_003485700 [Plakobranchus ocellatus]
MAGLESPTEGSLQILELAYYTLCHQRPCQFRTRCGPDVRSSVWFRKRKESRKRRPLTAGRTFAWNQVLNFNPHNYCVLCESFSFT